MIQRQTAHTSDRASKAVLIVPIVIAFWFLDSYAFQYLTLDRDRVGIYWARRDWLYVHIVAGMLALVLGPIQLWLGLNRREAILHRILGGAYVLAVFVSAGTALHLARHTDFGWVFGMGMTAMSVAWIVSTALGTLSICVHLVEQHREWMIRSYILTFGFVTFRMFTQFLQVAAVGTTLEQMTASSWFSWSVPLLIAEFIIQGRKIVTAGRRRVSDRQLRSRESAQIDLFDTASL
jgi:hypothetical protein